MCTYNRRKEDEGRRGRGRGEGGGGIIVNRNGLSSLLLLKNKTIVFVQLGVMKLLVLLLVELKRVR